MIQYLIAALVSGGVGSYAWNRRKVGGAVNFALVAFFQMICCLGFIFELVGTDLETKVFWNGFQVCFMGNWLFAFLAFSLQYTGRRLTHPKRTWILISIVPAVFFVLLITNRVHELVWTGGRIVPGQPFSELAYDFSSAAWLGLFYFAGLLMAGQFILVRRIVRSNIIYWAQIVTILLGMLIPLTAMVVTLAGLEIVHRRDIVPLSYAVSNLVVAWGLFRFRLFKLVPVAHDAVLDSLKDFVVVLDSQHRLIDLNPAAMMFLGKTLTEVVGEPVERVIPQWSELIEQYHEKQRSRLEIGVDAAEGRHHYELRLANEELNRENEAKYRSLFDNMQNACALHEIVLDWVRKYGEVALTGKYISIEEFSESLEKWFSIIAYRPNPGQFATVFGDITRQKRDEEKLRQALDELEDLKNRLQNENVYLQEEIKLEHNFGEIVGSSQAVREVLGQVEQVAATEATVLITGEFGTGKELLARAVHDLSGRKNHPLVKVNCAALPAQLIESELFGHEKGAFTGALSRTIGRFELADGGTIFLDEIGDLPLELQTKLLRVLQEGEFERLGNPQTVKVDVRVIAATNRNLEEQVENGGFRNDLFYRLNVFPLKSPPLRERKDDIPQLVRHFIKKHGAKVGKKVDKIQQKSLKELQTYHWPGNVRELENVVERGLIVTQGNQLQLGDWFSRHRTPSKRERMRSLDEIQKAHIVRALTSTNWRIRGDGGAAKILKIKPTTLEARMKKLDIKRQH
ncbi:MAG: PAS domain-containing protein [Proteobacteria bacterium]|nr:PAS domain-containing protein [Pseudomonadota bacterium]